MSEDKDQFRYLFSVRQRFNELPEVDAFYQLRMPAGITGDQARVMTTLNNDWCKSEIAEDTKSFKGMKLRVQCNSDMYQHVCLVRTHSEISAGDLELIIQGKHERGSLMEFLDGAAVK